MRTEEKVLDRAAATCILTLCFVCLHVTALKSQLFTRLGGLPYSTEPPVSYKTFYFDQKVSLNWSKCTFCLILYLFVQFYTIVFLFHFFIFHFPMKYTNCALLEVDLMVQKRNDPTAL